jgi:hypothetical protein
MESDYDPPLVLRRVRRGASWIGSGGVSFALRFRGEGEGDGRTRSKGSRVGFCSAFVGDVEGVRLEPTVSTP